MKEKREESPEMQIVETKNHYVKYQTVRRESDHRFYYY